MNYIKTIFLTIAILTFAACAAAQDKTEKKADNKITACEPTELKMTDEIKVIGESSDARIEKPFVFVARSAETYQILQDKIKDLPPASEIDFTAQAVIAAFGGEQRTGGYSVAIKRTGEKFSIKLNSPAPGAMTTDALTYPFQIAVVAVEEQKSLMLETSGLWKDSAETYKISGGKFDYSGGFAGRQRSIKPGGTISVFRFEDLVTFIFNVTGTDNKNLNSAASGKITDDKTYLARFEAGEFYELPHPPLVAFVIFKKDKISILLQPGTRDYVVNDGFSGRGTLEAVKMN